MGSHITAPVMEYENSHTCHMLYWQHRLVFWWICTDIQRNLLRPRVGEQMVPMHYEYTFTRPHSCHIPGDSSLK